MGKRKRPSSNKFKKRHPREIGKFYKARDKSGGHPALVYYCDIENDLYLIQRFSTKPRKDRKKLKHSINPEGDNEEWLIKKPSAVGYDDLFFEQAYINYRVHHEDEEIVQKYQKYNLKKTDEPASNNSVSPCDASSGEIIKPNNK